MWLNYNHLQYFWHVAREGSIAAAGRTLHVGVPGISAQIKQLETFLGQPLFRRRGRRLELTEAGRTAYEYADEIFSRGQELLGALTGDGGRRSAVFRVGLVDVLPKTVAWRLLRPALELEGSLRIVCREGQPEDLLADLARHRLDLVLSDGPVPRELDVRAYSHRLGESGTTFFAAGSLARRLRRRFPASLHGAPMLMPGARTGLRRALDDWLGDHAVRPVIVGEFDDGALLKVAGRDGFGVFAGPTAAESDIRALYSVAVVGRAADCVERFYAITGQRRIQHPAALAITTQARGSFFGERGAS